MSDLTLYHASPSRSSIALWMLEEVGAPYDIKLLRLSAGDQQKPDYLAINHDTLSRVMSRFEAIGLIRRVNRHAIRVTDIDRLGCQTPIGALVLAALARPAQYSSHN